jgi:hypothetical protein
MGRYSEPLFGAMVDKNGKLKMSCTIIHGDDNTLGKFVDITDERYANSGLDEQGEGYLFEWSELFGTSTNLIGLDIKDIRNANLVESLVEAFLKSKNIKID